MEKDFKVKQEAEGFQAEYEIHFVNEQEPKIDEDYTSELRELDEFFAKRLDELQELDEKIDRLTCHADKWDYTIAAASGLLTGLLDAFWVGDMKNAQELSSDKIDGFVKKVAQKKTGYSGDSVSGAINSLEENYKIPSDNIWKGTGKRISADTHHLDDMAHHPTLIGLFFSILTQFTYKGYFQNKEGNWFAFDVDEEGKKLIGKNLGSKLSAGVINWFFHLISDMAGSSGARANGSLGKGIPGPIVAFAKEIACIPGINKTKLPHQLKVAFDNYHCDFRCELTQSIPVLLNEIIVRSFYMIRRLVIEIKKCKSGAEKFQLKNLKNIIPFNNRTIARMMTVASGTFVAVDMADAAIRAAGTGPAAGATFVMHLNIPGMARCVIAVGNDLKMGLQKERARNKRLAVYQNMIDISEAKLYYYENGMWKSAKEATEAIEGAMIASEQAFQVFAESWKGTVEDLKSIQANAKNLPPEERQRLIKLLGR